MDFWDRGISEFNLHFNRKGWNVVFVSLSVVANSHFNILLQQLPPIGLVILFGFMNWICWHIQTTQLNISCTLFSNLSSVHRKLDRLARLARQYKIPGILQHSCVWFCMCVILPMLIFSTVVISGDAGIQNNNSINYFVQSKTRSPKVNKVACQLQGC